jgi:hypothetical protein
VGWFRSPDAARAAPGSVAVASLARRALTTDLVEAERVVIGRAHARAAVAERDARRRLRVEEVIGLVAALEALGRLAPLGADRRVEHEDAVGRVDQRRRVGVGVNVRQRVAVVAGRAAHARAAQQRDRDRGVLLEDVEKDLETTMTREYGRRAS